MTAQAPATGQHTRPATPPEVDDTTRYLAAAAHLDRHYADDAVREFLTEPTRQVPPAMGLDSPAVLTEAVAARSRRKYRDGVLAVLGLVVLATGFQSLILYAWFGWAAILSVRPIWRKTRWDRPGGVVMTCLRLAGLFLLYVVAWLIPFVTVLIIVLTTQGGLAGSGSSAHCTGYDCAEPATPTDGAFSTLFGGMAGAIAAVCALLMLGIVVADRVVVWRTVVRHFGRWARQRTDVAALTDDRPVLQGAPVRFREELRRHRTGRTTRSGGGFPLVVYRGRNPFVGAGTSVGAWSTAIPLEKSREAREPRPLTTDRLYRAAAAEITALTRTGALSPDRRLTKLTTSGVVFASAEALLDHSGDPARSEYLAGYDVPPAEFLSPAESNRVYAEPREWARYFLCFQVETWNRDLVFSAFLHVAVDDSNPVPRVDAVRAAAHPRRVPGAGPDDGHPARADPAGSAAVGQAPGDAAGPAVAHPRPDPAPAARPLHRRPRPLRHRADPPRTGRRGVRPGLLPGRRRRAVHQAPGKPPGPGDQRRPARVRLLPRLLRGAHGGGDHEQHDHHHQQHGDHSPRRHHPRQRFRRHLHRTRTRPGGLMTRDEETTIGIQAGTTISGGTIHGDVRGGTVTVGSISAGSGSVRKDLLDLLLHLKAEVAATDVPKQEVTAEHLDDLIAETRSPEPEPAVSRWCWQKITTALAGLKQFDDLIGRIGQHFAALWPS
ncbi:hypothetical protein OG738_39625 [Amycolatopsis sp. NBC_01488]|uniref:hypothetical protein n=1 Tax=Amycolatopsis sp. NBC_01488 TaxID=2903563 RepID=UPI002E2AB48B|nr:hypothetical protein [Amycolatopsis sp. NBC_01488]